MRSSRTDLATEPLCPLCGVARWQDVVGDDPVCQLCGTSIYEAADPAKSRVLKDEQFEHDYRMGTTPDE